MEKIRTQTLGYPRIGKQREIKRALEGYWKGRRSAEELEATFWAVAEQSWRDQLAADVDFVGVGSATYYDHVLDWAVRFGLIPERFRELEGRERYFAMARGAEGIPALDMTKWFDTNYHYLAPEIDAEMSLQENTEDFLELVRRAQGILGPRAAPIVLGPATLIHLSRFKEDDGGNEGDVGRLLNKLTPLYRRLLAELKTMGVPEVQLHEPALVLPEAHDLRAHIEAAYAMFADARLPLNLVTYFDDVGDAYPWIIRLPVDVITLDLTRGETLAQIEAHGFPADKTLAAGVIDGRSVWRMRPDEVLPLVAKLRAAAPNLRLSASCSLQFVPYDVERETEIPAALRGVLAFAEQKLEELAHLAADDTEEAIATWQAFRAFAPADEAVQARVSSLAEEDFRRAQPYEARRDHQIQLPPFPTTTIGSFPQTREVRRLRARYRKGEISEAAYHAGVDAFIAYTIGVQDALDLDVLVHGEFERSDMVEYFAYKLTGFAFTRHGWVQSFGSRYVRPPIIYADVQRPASMTVREFEAAQSFTSKPVKGMLTGPVTILNWSYPRVDIPREQIAYQLALALRDEIAALEEAGARVIQVDEPALREGLPLKSARWEDYLTWAVDAFRLTTGGARPATQIHTHMCYSEFEDILPAIDRLDADVISIENARSGDAMLRALAEFGYPREVGPGVYDIHSPVVPTQAFIADKLRMFREHLRQEQIWVNPDCGLKTRAWDEVWPALRNIIAVVKEMREAIE